MTPFPTVTPTGYHCPACDTPHPTATESILCALSHGEKEVVE